MLPENLVITMTNHTCGDACWHAMEDVCRCSCGGANHGILRNKDGKQPVRTSRIGGFMYRMKEVGTYNDLHRKAKAILEEMPPRMELPYAKREDGTQEFMKYPWKAVEDGSPIRVKTAGKDQAARWPELSQFRNLDGMGWYRISPAILWEKVQ